MRLKKEHSFNRKLFSKRIKDFREQLAMTQEEFANEINRTRSAYTVIERGAVSPAIHVIIDICNLLSQRGINVSLDYLCGRTDFQSDAEALKDCLKNKEQLQKDLDKEHTINQLQKQLLSKK